MGQQRFRLYISQILEWADSFKKHVGRWPNRNDGKIVGGMGLTWSAVATALWKGNRGLNPRNTLAKLLMEHRGRRHKNYLPHITKKKVLAWADAHLKRTGRWPRNNSGKIPDAPGETWLAVDHALRQGGRGQPRGSSLAELLEKRRGVRNHLHAPPLTKSQILAWVDAFKAREGRWPTRFDGPVPEAPGETWAAVHAALYTGKRGLPEGSSLMRFLAEHRGVRNIKGLPPLSVEQVLKWARAHHTWTGKWPNQLSGPIADAPGETWGGVHQAMVHGKRGFQKGSSLCQVPWMVRPKRKRRKPR